ncbi:GNAT family N-acetyltransferase [Umezawaea beigongshangensis]|uniref:GNAT family N-acetyltransferase n=1 Tax=Umezawaea beigongshangensis TaxID=2780383 RepID=UPI0027DD0304|nr:GNAT family N-acetyltransferase [Umezawaea beigongshangensis]
MSESLMSPSGVVRRWQLGWGAVRGLGPAEEVRGGLRVLIGQPGRHAEVVALHADDDPASLRGLAAEVAGAERPSWLTVPTTRPAEVAEVLRGAGLALLDRPEWLMTTELERHPARTPAEDYSVATTTTANDASTVVRVEVVHRCGDVAAHGTTAVTGADAVVHDVATVPAHRRRGLAAAVMAALARCARERGATTGLLVASADGRHLYSALGWTERAAVVIARTPDAD